MPRNNKLDNPAGHQITIMLNLGQPGKQSVLTPPEKPGKSIEEEVRESLELIESGHASSVEWRALRSLYSSLTKMTQNSRIKQLRKQIKPVLSKYGYHVE